MNKKLIFYRTLKLLLIILIVLASPFGEKSSIQNEVQSRRILTREEYNHIFLLKFFEGDSVLTKKYWKEFKDDSLREVVVIKLLNQELYVLDFSNSFNVKFSTKVSSGLKKGWTPTGEYIILYKLDFRPSITHGGIMYKWNCIMKEGVKKGQYAIHGLKDNNDYEKYLGQPKSHGCIRISNSVADYFYSMTFIGMKVLII